MRLSDFEYYLPPELIAQFPSDRRDFSNLMILDKKNQTILHKKFYEITDFFSADDVLVMNNTKVIPARLYGKKSTGGETEVFLTEKTDKSTWKAMVRSSGRLKEGTEIYFQQNCMAKLLTPSGINQGLWEIEFCLEGNFEEWLEKFGNIPLPPYIKREKQNVSLQTFDRERYQTIYAKNSGSVAAPTAGLHFTEELLEKIRGKGVEICFITLNVGLGTFKPVKTENILEHKMEAEYFTIPEKTIEIIKNAKQNGKNIIATGTTTARTLETAFDGEGNLLEKSGKSRLFIYPGYEFKIVNKIITNFHLPKSTLLMLVSAFAGREFILKAYKIAVENQYRFYSYGDCMFILE